MQRTRTVKQPVHVVNPNDKKVFEPSATQAKVEDRTISNASENNPVDNATYAVKNTFFEVRDANKDKEKENLARTHSDPTGGRSNNIKKQMLGWSKNSQIILKIKFSIFWRQNDRNRFQFTQKSFKIIGRKIVFSKKFDFELGEGMPVINEESRPVHSTTTKSVHSTTTKSQAQQVKTDFTKLQVEASIARTSSSGNMNRTESKGKGSRKIEKYFGYLARCEKLFGI